ncbi:asparagine synthase (glutamine-hydrolyzing) [Actinomadura harenae]|uniref:asparagine synthase (glutamine-hydrolyzing) n=1 Tax=Actinomadura harenae TaxID=2483351 RepID=UPI0013150607|nr:asparagine synthase (glutamine-hydrolyzing) [Actinomadura harenae]
MCGIAGLLRPPRPTPAGDPDRVLVTAMAAAMVHRGPHDQGIWQDGPLTLGHRRLAICDLSPGGHQPMTYRHLTITYNGELYNQAALRARLSPTVPLTSCDTQVVLAAWLQWGPAALEQMEGMFAFALWDVHQQRLTLARDRLGHKPLYLYSPAGGGIAFASEVDALLTLPDLPRRPHLPALHAQLLASPALAADPQATAVEAVTALPPGSLLSIGPDGRPARRTYWRPPTPHSGHDTGSGAGPPSTRRGRAAGGLGSHVIRATTAMLMGDVPAGVLLSGGLDSSVLTVIAARRASPAAPLHTFTLAYPGDAARPGSDLAHARAVAEQLAPRVALHQVPRTDTLALDDIDAVLDPAVLPDDPRHPAILATYQAAAGHGLRIVLNGQGTDELMSGYLTRPWFRHLLHPDAFAGLPASRQARALTPDVLADRGGVHARLLQLYQSMPATPLERAQHLLTATQIPHILRFEDRLAMRAGIEARFPYLDDRLVGWCLRHPQSIHIAGHSAPGGAQGKALLRRAFSPLLPAPVITRPKQVLPHPAARPLQQSLAALARDHHRDLAADPLIGHLFTLPNPSELDRLPASTLFQILGTWRWHLHLTRPPAPPRPRPLPGQAIN